mmetsp:Transcript_1659/g.2625  ORF Transcript_1659/g.2625 Transcript_1659/m.2625 type:complete len:438 (+) Transcript_1659:136-1449(+)
MHWVICGLIIFSFSAPSAVMGVPYAIGTQGIVVGVLLCILYTISVSLGAVLLIDLVGQYTNIKELKDLGRATMGSKGEYFATLIQNGNFFLFMPVALDIVASSAQDIIDPSIDICPDYFLFAVAAVCLATTQIRSFSNASFFSVSSLVCVFLISVIIFVVVSTNSNDDKKNAQLFGNPDGDSLKGVSQGLLGVTTAVWSYVPSFLVVELLSSTLPSKGGMCRAVVLSAALNVVLYVGVGVVVVCRWGWEMEDPITLVDAWPSQSTLSRIMSALLFISNLVSYSIDSVALTGKYIQAVCPDFDTDDWTPVGCLRFLALSAQPWALALVISIVAPNMFVILAFVTAFSVPWVTMIFPSLCFLCADSSASEDPLLKIKTDKLLSPTSSQRIAVWLLILGSITFIICLAAAVGKSAFADLRGDSVIGCSGWMLLDTSTDDD